MTTPHASLFFPACASLSAVLYQASLGDRSPDDQFHDDQDPVCQQRVEGGVGDLCTAQGLVLK